MKTIYLKQIFNSLFILLLLTQNICSMEIEWLHMSGQYPAERGPIIVDMDLDGNKEIVLVNRIGQVLHWTLDGKNIGKGQDGMALQLPEGKWTSRPIVVNPSDKIRFVACSVEGLVVAIDEDFQIAWEYQLPSQTTWGYAMPAVIENNYQSAFVYSDNSGMITCLSSKGELLWDYATNAGKAVAPPQTVKLGNDDQIVLIPIGTKLFNLSSEGKNVWELDLGESLSSQPIILKDKPESKIICGSKEGTVFGISSDGKLLWDTKINSEVNAFISLLPRKEEKPLILCTGLWGNLYAIDENGKNIWTHYFRSKGRGAPVVFDSNSDGDFEILVSTYAQHLYAFDEFGNIVDDVRLNNLITSSPILVFDQKKNRHDVLLTTAALTTYRISPSIPVSPYGITNKPNDISFELTSTDKKVIIVKNPNGGFINVNLRMKGKEGDEKITGCLTARSEFEIPLSKFSENGIGTFIVSAHDKNGILLAEQKWEVKNNSGNDKGVLPNILSVWATSPYGDYSNSRITP